MALPCARGVCISRSQGSGGTLGRVESNGTDGKQWPCHFCSASLLMQQTVIQGRHNVERISDGMP